MTCSGFVAPGFEISPRARLMSMRTGVAFQHALHCSRDLKILGTGHTGTIRSLDDFSVHPGTPIGRRALALASPHS
jgi:hypothetical protein